MTHAQLQPGQDGTFYRACNLCEAICGLQITVAGGKVVDIRGDEADPLSKGHICPKGTTLGDLSADPNRLKKPLRRVGDDWQELDWDVAYAEIAARLKEIHARHGKDAVASYQGNPTVHNSGTMLSASGFLKLAVGKARFTPTSADQLPHHFAAAEMLGHPLLLPIPDIDRCDFFMMLGANPLVSNGSIMTAPGMRERLRAIRERGGRVILLDPRRTESAAAATDFYFIRPATDALLLAAMLNVIFAEGLHKLGHLAGLTDGLDEVRAAVADLTPERVAAQTGLDAGTIRQLARDYAAAERAVIYGRIGVSVQEFGGLCHWLINVLNVVTGHFDREGGAMLPRPALDMLARARKGQTYHGRFFSRVRGLPEFDGELPVVTMTEEITTPGEGQIRALITIAGNPVLSVPDGEALDKALGTLELMVSIDPYLNETTRHAHYILPPAFGLETTHYDVIFHHFAVHNTARYNLPVLPITAEQRFDYQIFGELARHLGAEVAGTPHERIALGLEHGPYRLKLPELAAQPHGVDLGPLMPCLPERLLTADGRLKLAPAPMLADMPRLKASLDAQPAPLVLIGRRQLRSNNSWMHHVPRLMRGPERCTLQLSPADAGGLQTGAVVEVSSNVGRVQAILEVTDTLMPGVACLPHGFGHGRSGTRLGMANERPGVSINDLTDPQRIDPLTGNAAFNGLAVKVRAMPDF